MGQHGLGLLGTQVQQLFRMEQKVLQIQHFQAGVPKVCNGHGLVGAGGGQQSLAGRLGHVLLKRGQRIHLLHLPVELAAGDRLQGMQQRRQVDIAAGTGAGVGFEQNSVWRQRLLALQHAEQIVPGDSPLGIKLPVALHRQIAGGAGKLPRLGHRLGEMQLLVSVQGIVVHEILYRRLTGQHMFEVVYGRADLISDVDGFGMRHVNLLLKVRRIRC